MPAQERSLRDRRAEPGRRPILQSAPAPRGNGKEYVAPRVAVRALMPNPRSWDDAGWDHDHDEAAGHRARRLLARPNSGFHRFGDRIAALRRWVGRERWVKRLAVAVAVLMVIFAGCFGGLWWRLGAGPINLEMATPWLAAAIEDNIGHGNTVEVGGTQIERAGRIRIAVRIRDIIVRDRDHAIVASAPKAEVRLSGTALLMGRLRAESLNLVDAELAVRITPDGYVTVSTGDNAKPLATGVASKKEAGIAPTFPRPAPGMRRRRDRLRLRGRAKPRRDAGSRQRAKRTAGRPRLARQPEPDRTRRTEPQRDRSEERQSDRRRSAARQQMDVRQYQPQPAPAERRRRGVELRRGGRPCLVAAGRGRASGQWRAVGRYSRRQGLDHEYPAGAAAEGPDLQRRFAAVAAN